MDRTETTVGTKAARRRRRAAWAPIIASVLVLAGVTVALGATTTTIRTANDPTYGRILEGPARYTLYVFCATTGTQCAGHGSSTWPPLIAHGQVVAASGSQIKASKLSTRKLGNGQRQVTYYGDPLYLSKDDRKPGQTKGECKQQANGVWLVLSNTGRPLSNCGY
jgi:predicted lipoprotein with Yx(FWY)xxD motif